MSTADLQNTSQMAIRLWTGRDAAVAQAGSVNGRPRRNSLGESAYSHTVMGTGTRVEVSSIQHDHGLVCDGCAQVRLHLLSSTCRTTLKCSLSDLV